MSEFEQREESIQLLEEHGKPLAIEAAELIRQYPGAQPVGLILTADAAEAKELRAALTASTGQDLTGKGFVGLVPREMALTILRANAPATLDWLEPSSEGSTRVLPLIAATKDGFRLGATEYP